MLIKQIKYTDFNGQEVTDTFHFHLSKMEIVDWEVETEGGLEARMKNIISSESTPQVIQALKDIILRCVGRISEDGKRFDKNGAAEEFSGSPAFEELVYELLTNPTAGAEFIAGAMPKELQKHLPSSTSVIDGEPIKMKKKPADSYTIHELTAMPHEEFKSVMDTIGPRNMSRDMLMLAYQRRAANE
jgi:hypothetical protein